MPNQLAGQNSPYLLQHKDNPVDWHPWDQPALEKAKTENKPIFLSIGYAACHWCHVMERESFEDHATAEIMNQHFINIKVDREERPDLDGIYMSGVVALTGQGGWPMSVFLTPNLEPFFGGTYFPPVPRHGMPSFSQVLTRVAELWKEQPEELLESGKKLTKHLQVKKEAITPGSNSLNKETLDTATQKLIQSYDWTNGGWGGAPKFPQPMSILYLLRQASRGNQQALQISAHALKSMAQGGMYDLVGGGFARYSVDAQWLVPHFEKMLYDNAQLARAYLHAFLLTGDEYFHQITKETLDFVLREITHPDRGFYSSIDADSEGEEGKFYLWDYEELRQSLSAEDFTLVEDNCTITEGGNFENINVLRRKRRDVNSPEVETELNNIFQKLLTTRNARIRPATDDKVLVSWNAWMNLTFSEAGRYLKNQRYLQAAQNNMSFLLNNLVIDDRLMRSWRAGRAQHPAYLEDYGSLVIALLSLYQGDHNNYWFEQAVQFTNQMIALFSDEDGHFYDTASDQDSLLVRPQEIQDNATPSGSSLAVQALLQIAAFTGESNYHDRAVRLLAPSQKMFASYPLAFSSWLAGLDFSLGNIKEIALLGDLSSPAGKTLLNTIWSQFRPDIILAASNHPPEKNAPPLLRGRPLINQEATAFVCKNFTCQKPTTSPEVLREQLSSLS